MHWLLYVHALVDVAIDCETNLKWIARGNIKVQYWLLAQANTSAIIAISYSLLIAQLACYLLCLLLSLLLLFHIRLLIA